MNFDHSKGVFKQESEPLPSNNLYVWQLPQESTDQFLRELFQQCGTVASTKVVEGKRFGFVMMGTTEEATYAITAINGLQCHGTTIKVKFADNAKGGGKGCGGGGGNNFMCTHSGGAASPRVESVAAPSDNLYVWQLPAGSDDDFLRQLFQQVGAVESVKCFPDRKFGFVRFSTVEEATLALTAINGLSCHGTVIKVKFADNPKGGGKGGGGAFAAQQPSWNALAATAAAVGGFGGLGGGLGGAVAASPAQADSLGAAASGADINLEGLPADLKHDDIKSILELYCTAATCKVIKNDGFRTLAVVNIADKNEVTWLIENLNGNIPQGLETPIWISAAPTMNANQTTPGFAPPRNLPAANNSRYSPYGDGSGATDPNNTNLYVYQLPQGADDDKLWQLFSGCGNVVSVKVNTDRRFGFVKMSTVEEAQGAIAMISGQHIEGSNIICQFANRDRK